MSEKSETNRSAKIALILSALAIFGVVTLMLGSYYFYEEEYFILNEQTIALRSQIASLIKAKQSVTSTVNQETLENMKQELAMLRAELAKTSNNRQKILSDVNTLVLIANEKLQFSHDVSGAITALKMAQQHLLMGAISNVSDLKEALNKDVAALSAIPAFDQQALWEEVGALSTQIDKLKWKELGVVVETSPAKTITLSSWQSALHGAWDEFKSLIKITRIEQNPIPLTGLVQEQAQLKRELQWLVTQAQWAVLQKSPQVYIVSLKNIEKLVKAYFVEDSEENKLLQQLNALAQKNIVVSFPSLTETLQALSASLDVKE